MAGGGVSFGDTATLDTVVVEVEYGDDDGGAALALLLLTCLGVPGQISHLNGIEPGLLHESSIAAAIAARLLLLLPSLSNASEYFCSMDQ
jgi:hypothetical protein